MAIVLTAVIAWAIAQISKIVINYIINRKFDFWLLFASGGMPSSHTALVVSATTKIYFLEGINSSIFGLSLILSFVIMYDAVGVRQSVGIQAKAINNIIHQLTESMHISHDMIKEVYGHTIVQVFAGMILGIVVGCIF